MLGFGLWLVYILGCLIVITFNDYPADIVFTLVWSILFLAVIMVVFV